MVARGQLIIQQPRVSLIGGSELPKASGAGVPVPDFSRPFDRLAADLQAKSEQNRRLVSDMEGTTFAEAEFTDKTQGGKDASGYYRELPPLPNGDPYFQAAYLRTRAENIRSQLNRDISGSLSRIQLDDTKPAATRSALMSQHIEGALEGLDPLLRQQARTDWNREFEQRTEQMVRDEADKKLKADLRGIEIRYEDGVNMAISAASTGADYTPELNRALEAIDDKVRLGIINETDGVTLKEQTTELVGATGVQAQIATDIMDGRTPLEDAEEWATSLKSGAVEDKQLRVYNRNYDPNSPVDMPREFVYSTQEIARKFRNPETAMAVGTRLQEVIGMRRAGLKSAEGLLEMAQTIQRIGPTDLSLPSPMRGTYNKAVSELIVNSGGLTAPGSAEQFVAYTEMTKVVPDEAVNFMRNTILGNDLKKAFNVLTMWQVISTKKRGNAEIGLITKQSMDAKDVALLDSAVEYANSIGADINNPDSLQRFRDWQVAAADPDNTVDRAITRFNEYSKNKNWGTQLNDLYAEKYGTSFNIDPRFRRQMELTYHVVAGSANNVPPDQAMQKAFDMVSSNWTNSDIYQGGIQPTHDPLTNPVTYGEWYSPLTMQQVPRPEGWFEGLFRVQKPQSDTAWASDYTHGSLAALDDNNALVLDNAEERAEFDALMNDGQELLGLGRMQLRATTSNRRYTQFNVVMTLPDGTQTLLKTRDGNGNAVPVLLDHSLVLANVNSKVAVRKQNEELRSNLQRGLFNIAAEQYQSAYGMSDPASRTLMSPNMSPNIPMADIEKFVLTQDKEFQKYWKDSKDKMIKSLKDGLDLNDQKVPVVPDGSYIPPENLLESRAYGPEVSIAAVQAIERVLPDGTGGQFMLNLIATESDFGRAAGTFRKNGDKGLTQINTGDMGAFKEMIARANTEGDPIREKALKLKSALGIDIAGATTSDLDRPLYAVAFARLYMTVDPRQIPKDVEQQGVIWKDHYNTVEGAGTVEGFIQKAGKVLMPPTAEAALPPPTETATSGTPVPVNQAERVKLVTDMSGKPSPANFLATDPGTQEMAYKLATVFGQPLKITPHGGTQPDKRRSTSQHKHGTALDIWIGDMTPAQRTELVAKAVALGYRGIGGYGPNASDGYNTLHLDLRAGRGRGPSGIAAWWRHRSTVDDKWDSGEKWFVDGINKGDAMLRQARG